MHHAEQIAVAKRLLKFIGSETTELSNASYQQPIDEYTRADIAAREERALFRERPLCVGLSHDLPAPGSYRSHDLLGVPLLLVRDLSGTFKAFLNVCRHRGARVAAGCGSTRGFTCPYHAWVYGLDGAIVSRPDEGSFADVPRVTHGLTALPAVELHGLLMVCPTPGGTLAPDAGLGALVPELAAYKLDTFHHYASRDLTRRMNWKLVVDTFLESYHFCVLHRNSICSIFYR